METRILDMMLNNEQYWIKRCSSEDIKRYMINLANDCIDDSFMLDVMLIALKNVNYNVIVQKFVYYLKYGEV